MQSLLVLRRLCGLRHEWLHAKQDLAVIRVTTALYHTLFHVSVIGCGALDERLNSEDDLGVPGRKVPSASRCASLDDHRTALRRWRHVQRTAGAKEPAHVVDT